MKKISYLVLCVFARNHHFNMLLIPFSWGAPIALKGADTQVRPYRLGFFKMKVV